MALVFRALALSLEVGGRFYDLSKFYGSEIGKAKERKFETPTRETDCWAGIVLVFLQTIVRQLKSIFKEHPVCKASPGSEW